jgi:thiol-disulfide isomerase/thioredoxin
MMKKFNMITLALISLLLLAACTAGGETAVTTPNEPMVEEAAMEEDAMIAESDAMMAEDSLDNMAETNEMMAEDDHGDDMMSDEEMADTDSMNDMADIPDWQAIELTDARTGETFTLASFSGKTVFVEPMATWCTNCRQQLGNVREARAQLGDDVVFIGLSLETNLASADLAQYQSDQGFDWTFAVMTPEMLQGLADTFGRSITSAPSTPHFVIRPDGSYTDLVTGIDPVDQIVSQIQAAGS